MIWQTPPMGELRKLKKTALAQASEDVMVADTMGGRMDVRWDETAQATPHGQIVFFAEFLATAGVFDRWVQGCPLHYSSPNASRARDVLGTLMLGILAGSKRYAHIAGIRGDAVAAKALGLQGMVSEDSVRRALKAMEPADSEPWVRGALMASVREALDRPWVLASTPHRPLPAGRRRRRTAQERRPRDLPRQAGGAGQVPFLLGGNEHP